MRSVLDGISLHIPAGQTVGVVGPSGSGKSTLISLLMQFYEPTSGRVLFDENSLDTVDTYTHRSRISLVSQETQLFEGSVRSNILLGIPDDINFPTTHLEDAARAAGIHDFILSLPDGYNTECGRKGMAFSGGQRQRLAIARALVRTPSVLLLDEATSALDSESERGVKEALDRAGRGRTTVVVAHRLATVKEADCIFVLVDGKIVEKGRHGELISRGGVYWRMCHEQRVD
jgi:ATP-binding cassette, subfamily B (MDR/TAP), member 1